MYLAIMPRDTKASIDEIARAYDISSNHLVKVVHHLGKLGFIETTRGRGGGIRLKKQPAEIRIGAVIRATEPSLAVVECFNAATNSCPLDGACALKPWLGKAMAAFLVVLDKVTLADITDKPKKLASILGTDALSQ